MAYGRKMNGTNPLIAFDANSLYPTVMKNIKEFPDIYNSEKILSDTSYESIVSKYKFYILCCDVYLPHMYFIPVPNKKEGEASCFYNYGNLKQQTYNDVDIGEIYRCGGYITKIYYGLGFT